MDSFFITRQGVQSGPFSRADVERQLAEGAIDANDLFWAEGMAEWQPISTQLAPHPPPLPPALPAPPHLAAEPIFLYISPLRLIGLSIFSSGVYEVYWIYKNWSYLKARNSYYREIRPFWRAWFGIFYIHSLLKAIHDDHEALAVETPKFTPQVLATAWIVLMLISNALGRVDGLAASLAGVFMPSFLCLLPVQLHINRVTTKLNPGARYYGFSPGHVVCILIGLLIWLGILMQGLETLGVFSLDGGGSPTSDPNVL